MHCGKISLESDAEEIAVSPKPKYRQRHGRLNPYSTTGLDKFESIYVELSAKREYIAQKTGAPEAMVRFVSSKKGWIPVVLGPEIRRSGGKPVAGMLTGFRSWYLLRIIMTKRVWN
jgi:hypothetical protein